MNIDEILTAYLQCALWTGTDNDDVNLGDRYDLHNISREAVAKARADVVAFVAANQADLVASGLEAGHIGHDFWLTRNGHGSGFWDAELGELGDRLTDACSAFPEVDLYVGDDGRLYL